MTAMTRARELCLAQLAAGKTRQQVSVDIGYSRTAVSLYLSGKYRADAADLETAICRAYDRRHCPHTGASVEPGLCRKKALSPKPFGGAERLAWWTTCQTCPHKPLKEEAK
jgi:hypothetical protein